MLYAKYYAWTHDSETIERLWPNALAAMEWIDIHSQATGYLGYIRTSRRGLVNQGWKDSGDCIVNRQGELATGPISLCEVQVYVYAVAYHQLTIRWAITSVLSGRTITR